jgi:class 3 adenylate cyclase/tetratricopeptide (TPR) repeat protein
MVCPSCGQENPEGFRFCPACAAPLAQAVPPREERKVITVLFCDLVGSTAQGERLDPEDLQALLSRYHGRVRTELERFGGTVEKFIGDAVVALFGVPVAHEDDPERAVRAALAVREWVSDEADLHVRVAVNTGEALVMLSARVAHGEHVASGDVLNTAARLQAAAPVDGIVVGEQTYRATEPMIEYRKHKPVLAKGKAEPVPVWEVVQARAAFGIDVAQVGAPLVGRRRELGVLADALTRIREERSPQLVTIVGVPGIGKTRLVYELNQVVDTLPELIFWRQGRSLPYGEGVTYWALAEMVKAQAGILESDTSAETERKLHQATLGLLPEETEARWVESQLGPLVGLRSEEEVRAERSDESFPAWRRFFEAMAEQRPLVLVFEDLHWADGSLLDFVDYLVDWATEVPLLVVCTARPELLERRAAWGGGKSNALTLSLAPLSDEETVRLLAQLLQRSVLAAETQTALLAHAGGNPLYAEQFARMVDERGSVGDGLPETVQGIIAARLDALAADEKALLQDAAVVGKVFWAGAVAAISGQARTAVEQSLHGLERKEFVRRERRSAVAGEMQLVFRHLLVRDVAYGQIPRAARAERHRLAAEWLESLGRAEDHAEMLAHHYLSALEFARAAGEKTVGLEQRARLALRDAGDRALALGAFLAAAHFYEGALDLWPEDGAGLPALLLRYGKSRYQDVSLDEGVLERASDGLLELGDREGAAEAESLLGWLWWARGQREYARVHLERALELVRAQPTTVVKAYVLSDASRFNLHTGELEAAFRLGTEALALAEELGIDELRASNLNNIGVARIEFGETEQGVADLERAVELGAAANSWQEWRAALNLAWHGSTMLGDLRRAWDRHLQSSRIAARRGLEFAVRWERGERVFYTYWRGDWVECERVAGELIDESAESGHYQESVVRRTRALIRLARDDIDGALADASSAVELARKAVDRQILDPALLGRAQVLEEVGRRNDADTLLSEVLELWRERDVGTFPEAVLAARLAVKLGRLEELRETFRHVTKPGRWIEAARTIAAGEFALAADQLEQIGSLSDEAAVRLLAATELRRQGQLVEADSQLRRALAFYRSVAAMRYIREGEAILAASA